MKIGHEWTTLFPNMHVFSLNSEQHTHEKVTLFLWKGMLAHSANLPRKKFVLGGREREKKRENIFPMKDPPIEKESIRSSLRGEMCTRLRREQQAVDLVPQRSEPYFRAKGSTEFTKTRNTLLAPSLATKSHSCFLSSLRKLNLGAAVRSLPVFPSFLHS